jgi:hypothetical protein
MDTIIHKLRENWLCQLTIIYLRYLLGISFILPSIYMGKLGGANPFTYQGDLNNASPFELFFQVMSTSGLYWHFIGAAQIIAGILLATQRFAKLGALLFFGMILNILFITISFQFKGTPIVAGLMTVAAIVLLLWDIESFKPLFLSKLQTIAEERIKFKLYHHPFWSLTGMILCATTMIQAWFKPSFLVFVVPLMIGLMAMAIYYFFISDKRAVK